MKVIIDRFEGLYVVCEKENKIMLNIRRDLLPKEAKEGDVLIIDEEEVKIDVKETIYHKSELEKLSEELWQK